MAISRNRDESDGRLTRVYPTEVGRKIDREKGFIRDARINQILAGMAEKDRRGLIGRLNDLTGRLQQILHSNPAQAPSET